MKRSSRAAAGVVLLAFFSLTGCGSGGGDDDVVANDDKPVVPSADRTACFPDRATYDSLVLHTTAEEAVKRIGCPAYEVAPNDLNSGDKIYRWTDLQDGRRSIELVFSGTLGLRARTGYFSVAEGKPSSACEPTRAAFDQLQMNVTDYLAAAHAFGCEGELRVDILTFTGHERRFAWGHYGDKVRPMVLVAFTRGLMSNKLSERLP